MILLNYSDINRIINRIIILEKEYNIGDIVYIKSLSWYQNSPKDEYGTIDIPHKFMSPMMKYCGRKAKINDKIKNRNGYFYYYLDIDSNPGHQYGWTAQMFDETKSRKEKLKKLSNKKF